MNKIALDLGIIQIYWYSICIFLGVLIGSIYIFKEAKRKRLNTDFVTNLMFYSVIFGFIGARLYYIKLGQSAPTLYGGEAGRVKLAKELQKKGTGKTLFILDEPTTGLHSKDIQKLLEIFNKIVDNKDTVVIIEHNLDVIKVADHIIDLGPDGGDNGGTIIATGTPEEVSKVKGSYTGEFLKKIL